MTIGKADNKGRKWKTLKEIYRHYLMNSENDDGESAEEVFEKCFAQRHFEDHCFRNSAQTTQDRLHYEEAIKALDAMIERVRARVLRFILEEAKNAKWIAIGRRRPEAGHELIPPQNWPFLTLDIENAAAVGDEFSFRDLRCWITKDLAKDDPLRELLLRSQQTFTLERPAPATLTATSSTSGHLGRNGIPGRPSYIHLIEREFNRRRSANVLCPSLNEEAEHLAIWSRTKYPGERPYTAKTIKNRLRKPYREAINPNRDPK